MAVKNITDLHVLGNVGIGTTSPGAKLDVVGSIGVTSGNTFGFDNYNGSIYMASSGRGLLGKFGGSGYARNLIKSDGSATVHIGDNTSLISRILLDAGSSGANGYISLQTKQVERVRINQDGNVGIGTTAPTNRLDVVGNASVSSLRVGSSASGEGIIRYNPGSGNGIGIVTGTLSSSGIGLFVSHDNNNRNVGIGTTSPNDLLQIGDTLGANASMSIASGGTSSSTLYFRRSTAYDAYIQVDANEDLIIGYNSANLGDSLKIVSNTTNVATFDSSGNVGIGGSPASVTHGPHLDIVGNRGTLTVGTGYFEDNGTTNFLNGARPLAFGYAGSEHMRVHSNGNVGIGTTAPSRRLDVDGIQGWQLSNLETAYLNPTATGADFALKDQYNANIIRLDSRPNAVSYFNGGNVGIGTANTYAKLSVYASSHNNGISVNRQADTTAALYIGNDGGNNPVLAANNADMLFGKDVSSTFTEYMRLTTSGTLKFAGSTNGGELYADDFGLKVGTSSGYIQFGHANTTWAHIYTDRSNFYFNKNLFVLGNRLATESWVNANFGTPTLDAVTTAGSVTTNNIGVGLIQLGGDTEHRLYRATTSLVKGTTTDTTVLMGRTLDLYAYDDVNIRAGSGDNISFTAGGVSNAMYINSSGNVGMGTTSPSTKLHVQGPITVSNTNPLAYYNSGWGEPWQAMMTVGWGSTPGDYLMLRAPGNSATAHGAVQIGDNLFKVGRTDTEYDQPATDDLDTTWMMANSTGVGIGTTSPSTNLQTGDGSAGIDTSIRAYHSDGAYTEIRGYGLETNRTTAYIRPTGDKNAVMAFGNDGRTWNYVNVNTNYFVVATDTAEHLRITNTGNVGIGTTSPSEKLQVIGNIQVGTGVDHNSKIAFTRNGGANVGAIGWHSDYAFYVAGHPSYGSTAGNIVRVYGFGSDVRLGDNTNGDVLTVASGNGNVGIGTTSPAYTLDVNGSMHSTNITIADAIYHEGDTDTYIRFNTDTIELITGGGIRTTINNNGVKFGGNTIIAGGSTLSLGERAEADDNGRTVLIEGVANAGNGEGSGRIFFTEHNSTTASADKYGLSLYYEGDPNAQLPSGFQPNTGNATWSLRRHDNLVNGVAIMSGSRTNSNVDIHGRIYLAANNSHIAFNTSASSGDPKIQMGSDGDFSFLNTAGSTSLHIENGGNVGIGTTSPIGKLDVANDGLFLTSTNTS